jgi:hypothetical protein
MSDLLSYHLNLFSEKVRAMNDTSKANMMLSASEARNLHSDIFILLAKNAELSDKLNKLDNSTIVKAEMDGGSF